MPRLPVDGKRVVEHRITLGTYERDQINRFVDGMQVRNIGQGIGAATDPIEAMLSNTLGTVGGVFLVSWALKRFFNVDVPIPTDLEDVTEGWQAIYGAISGISDEARAEIDAYIDKIDLKEKAEILSPFAALIPGFPLLQFGTRILKGAADFIFTPLDNPRFDPNYGDIYADYVDPGLQQGIDDTQQDPEFPADNPFSLTPEERDCVLEKLNLHATGVDPLTKTIQGVTQAMVQICGINPGKAGAIYQAWQNGETI